jgi:hypothetical protein
LSIREELEAMFTVGGHRGEMHRRAQQRVHNIFVNNGWESTIEEDLSLPDLDGKIRPYRGDVVGIQRDMATNKIIKRIVVEVDGKIGHTTGLAFAKDKIRKQAIQNDYKDEYGQDAKECITKVKSIPTSWLVGRKAFEDDEVLKLEFEITELSVDYKHPTNTGRMKK